MMQLFSTQCNSAFWNRGVFSGGQLDVFQVNFCRHSSRHNLRIFWLSASRVTGYSLDTQMALVCVNESILALGLWLYQSFRNPARKPPGMYPKTLVNNGSISTINILQLVSESIPDFCGLPTSPRYARCSPGQSYCAPTRSSLAATSVMRPWTARDAFSNPLHTHPSRRTV